MSAIRQAMILAAGLGRRMRPLTEATPKPLLPLGRRPLLDHALDRLAQAGVTRVVVNAHWRGERLEAHLAARTTPPAVLLRPEDALLGTGGAVAAALAAGDLEAAPFYVVNGDTFWLDGPVPALHRLRAAFDPAGLDAVLLVHRTFQVRAETGFGDFTVDKWGHIGRRGEREVVPYVYAGVQLAAPALLAGAPAPPFSLNWGWDRAIAAGRVRAVVHDGLWFHLSTPADLAEAELMLHAQETGETR